MSSESKRSDTQPSRAEERLKRIRQAAELYYRWHYPIKMISAQLNCSMSEVSRLLKHAREQNIVEIRVNPKDNDEFVYMSFDFPREVRVPCEQYLLYFGQFLQDLGVEANATVTEEAGQVLFTVRPTNKKDALDKIWRALELYLDLPSRSLSNTESESIAIQRLEANILRLRSDLKLAAAEIQAKNATIQAHELAITAQKRLLTGEVILDSRKSSTTTVEDKENLIGGIVALSTYKNKGVEINLAEIFRTLKKVFSNRRK